MIDPLNPPRLTLGDFELTVLTDGGYWLDGGNFFGVIPKVMWERRMQPDERNRLRVSLNSLLVRTGEKTVLIETGIGSKLREKQAAIYGPEQQLLLSLEAAGCAPDEVDLVINTHLHFDHCGWNTVMQHSRPVATFPRAKYFVQRGEWEHGRKQLERDRVSYLSANYDPLVDSGQMELLEGDRALLPGVSVRVLSGHTRHMQAVMLESKGQRACYVSDLIPTTAHLDLPWAMAFDLFPLETIENKKKVYAEALPEKWLMVFTHDPDVPWGYLEKDETGKLVARKA